MLMLLALRAGNRRVAEFDVTEIVDESLQEGASPGSSIRPAVERVAKVSVEHVGDAPSHVDARRSDLHDHDPRVDLALHAVDEPQLIEAAHLTTVSATSCIAPAPAPRAGRDRARRCDAGARTPAGTDRCPPPPRGPRDRCGWPAGGRAARAHAACERYHAPLPRLLHCLLESSNFRRDGSVEREALADEVLGVGRPAGGRLGVTAQGWLVGGAVGQVATALLVELAGGGGPHRGWPAPCSTVFTVAARPTVRAWPVPPSGRSRPRSCGEIICILGDILPGAHRRARHGGEVDPRRRGRWRSSN